MIKKFKPKQPYEEYYVYFNFANDLGTGVTVASVASFTAVDTADSSNVLTTLTDTGLQFISGQKVYFWARAGTTLHTYKFECKIVGSDGAKYENEGTMLVMEV